MDYVKEAIRTEAPYDQLPTRVGSVQLCRILHASIGLCTEVGELFEAVYKPEFTNHAKEEMGDLWWYFALLSDAIARPLHPADQVSAADYKGGAMYYMTHVAACVGNIQDVAKRTLFYGKELNEPRIALEMEVLEGHLVALCFVFGTTPADCQAANIAKLRARYPAKFTEENAVTRNIENERMALDVAVRADVK